MLISSISLGTLTGRHVDSYSYAFNMLLECPGPGEGGELQMGIGSRSVEHFDRGRTRTIPLKAGDCYFMRTDEHIHRVSPLEGPGVRAVINFAYANRATLTAVSYSSSRLYG